MAGGPRSSRARRGTAASIPCRSTRCSVPRGSASPRGCSRPGPHTPTCSRTRSSPSHEALPLPFVPVVRSPSAHSHEEAHGEQQHEELLRRWAVELLTQRPPREAEVQGAQIRGGGRKGIHDGPLRPCLLSPHSRNPLTPPSAKAVAWVAGKVTTRGPTWYRWRKALPKEPAGLSRRSCSSAGSRSCSPCNPPAIQHSGPRHGARHFLSSRILRAISQEAPYSLPL